MTTDFKSGTAYSALRGEKQIDEQGEVRKVDGPIMVHVAVQDVTVGMSGRVPDGINYRR